MSEQHSYLSNAHPDYIDSLYEQYKSDPESVDFGWRKFFEGFEFAGESFDSQTLVSGDVKEIYVLNLINAYRHRGHLFTHTNPVRERRKYEPTLALESFNLSANDLETEFNAGVDVGLGKAKLKDIIQLLEETYCQSIGVEYMYMKHTEIVQWLRKKLESNRNQPDFSIDEKKHILHKLNQAVVFEKFLGTKYVGQKRFSLEGAETLIPALDAIIEKGAELGSKEFIIGMAHRGRLNVLANIIGKTYEDIFREFEEDVETNESFEGDVKYHMGFSSDIPTEKNGEVHLTLCPNPSHLESVDPVAIGNARAKIDLKYKGDTQKLTPIIIHGDASVAAQGVVYEVTQMAELEAYQVGGTIHVIINNQVGFTTNYLDGRSSTYCTDVAKVTGVPVFHVNGDDVEAVVHAIELAMEFRQKFNKDVFIDLLCYRRHGHNEGDEPRFTQPTLYKIIEKHPNPREIYFEKLLQAGKVEASLAKEMEKSFKKMLQERLDEVKQNAKGLHYSFKHSGWRDLRRDTPEDWESSPETGVDKKKLIELGDKICTLPQERPFYKKAQRIIDARHKMLHETNKLDWAMGELLAYASLLEEGYRVRISGQDSERGTFAHRHAVLRYDGSEEEYVPLNNLSDKQKVFEVYNSLLSEYAVLGFEYGYCWSAPYSLVVWEAQFGDFVNGAQIIIDQYISSAELKWNRLNGLVMYLPHGYEGQGPEHSSARMERFLGLCANNNMQVVNPTTPAQMFHLLRRQMTRSFRVPLVVLTPKNLLRLPEATSPIEDLAKGKFQELIDDPYVTAKSVKKVLLCSGKLYYDLLKQQQEGKRKEVAIIRLEQLYPLPEKQLNAIFEKYKQAKEWVWVQEEPENMGPWPFILRKIRSVPLKLISRKENASPATGYKKQHILQQEYIIKTAFDIVPETNESTQKVVTKVR